MAGHTPSPFVAAFALLWLLILALIVVGVPVAVVALAFWLVPA